MIKFKWFLIDWCVLVCTAGLGIVWIIYDLICNINRKTSKAKQPVSYQVKDRRYKHGYRLQYGERTVNVPATEEEIEGYKQRVVGHLIFLGVLFVCVLFTV